MFNLVMRRMFAMTFLCTMVQMYIFMPATQAQEPRPDEKALLWRISGKGIKGYSYLFGTIHQICESKYIWTAAMQEAFDQSEKVCMEMDLDDPRVQMEMMTGLMSNDGKSLKSYFSNEEYDALEKYMEANFPNNPIVSIVDKLQPVGIYTFMLQTLITCQVGDKTSYEMSLMQKAQSSQKEILGLESAKDQIKALQSMPTDSVIKQINTMVSGGAGNKDLEMYEALVATYVDQDIVGMKKMMDEQAQQQLSLQVLLDERNEKWIKPMSEMMHKNSIFFAVGAGHLAGPKGVIALLREKGYTLEPIFE